MKNNWLPKKKTLIMVSSVLVSAALLYLISVFVIIDKHRQIQNFYIDTESAVSKAEREWALKYIVTSYAGEIKSLRDFLVKKGDEVYFIEEIENLARTVGVGFTLRAIDLKESEVDFKEDISVRLDVKGDWQTVTTFLDKLEKLSFGVLIENLDLKADSPGEWQGSISFLIFREK